jgi:pimeloyl-ACP methyl ester carboxylesterase
MGTNSSIYEAQLAPIYAHLGSEHELVFVDGMIECDAADGVGGIFPAPFFCYYSKPTKEQLQAAFDLVYEVIDEEGPFDGVFGFSQGAALAASMLMHHQKTNPAAPDLFKVAVFMCASLPFDLHTESQVGKYHTVICSQTGRVELRDWAPGEVVEASKVNGYIVGPSAGEISLRRYHAGRERDRISIPTVHVIGELDPFRPQSKALADLCGDDKDVIVHELGHELPRDGLFARKATSAITRSISKALFRC